MNSAENSALQHQKFFTNFFTNFSDFVPPLHLQQASLFTQKSFQRWFQGWGTRRKKNFLKSALTPTSTTNSKKPDIHPDTFLKIPRLPPPNEFHGISKEPNYLLQNLEQLFWCWHNSWILTDQKLWWKWDEFFCNILLSA